MTEWSWIWAANSTPYLSERKCKHQQYEPKMYSGVYNLY